jgi:photosystem II stability/assembly factor-like uncharacterized protein
MRGRVGASIVTLACALAIVAARAPWLSGAGNPSLLFARSQPNGAALLSAVDPRGFIYVAGVADRITSNGVLGPTSAFVTKLTPSGTPVYTTYFQGSQFSGEYDDCGIEIHAIAVDRNGAAYVAGCTSAIDFPVVRPLVATLPDSRGGAFVAKIDPAGAFVYATYFPAYDASAIAADDDGQAYVVGAYASRLPLVNAALTEGSGFAAKLDATGSRLLFSTYLDAMPRAVTIDRSGSAYVAGDADVYVSQSGRAPRCDPSGDASVIKLAPSGSRYDYAICLGGSGYDVATGIAVDSSGAAYVVGTTGSVDFPTVRPLDLPLHTGALWKTTDAGGTWTNLPLGVSSAGQLVASAARPPTWFADASFRSVDQGQTWQRLGQSFFRVAPDPRSAHTLYGASFAGLFKSVDDGEQWSAIGAPPRSTLSWPLVFDPRDSRIVYAVSNGAVWRSTDGGATWTSRNNGLGTRPRVRTLVIGPDGVLFAPVLDSDNLNVFIDRIFTSADGGATWTATAFERRNGLVDSLIVVPGRRGPAPPRRPDDGDSRSDPPPTGGASTVYAASPQFFNTGPFGILSRSNDNGATWTTIGAGLPRVGVDMLAIAPSDAAIVFATSLGALFISRDRGDTFQRVATPWSITSVAPLAIDPQDARTVFVGASGQADGFVAKIAPAGGAFEYATYLGGAGSDIPAGVVVDELGRAIVFGSTDSIDFPAVAPLQQRGSDGDGFVSVLDGGGSVLLTSTWVGGSGVDRITSAARRGRELIITGGSTDLPSMFPGANTVTAGGFVGVLDLSYGALERTRAVALVRPGVSTGSFHLNRE